MLGVLFFRSTNGALTHSWGFLLCFIVLFCIMFSNHENKCSVTFTEHLYLYWDKLHTDWLYLLIRILWKATGYIGSHCGGIRVRVSKKLTHIFQFFLPVQLLSIILCGLLLRIPLIKVFGCKLTKYEKVQKTLDPIRILHLL